MRLALARRISPSLSWEFSCCVTVSCQQNAQCVSRGKKRSELRDSKDQLVPLAIKQKLAWFHWFTKLGDS